MGKLSARFYIGCKLLLVILGQKGSATAFLHGIEVPGLESSKLKVISIIIPVSFTPPYTLLLLYYSRFSGKQLQPCGETHDCSAGTGRCTSQRRNGAAGRTKGEQHHQITNPRAPASSKPQVLQYQNTLVTSAQTEKRRRLELLQWHQKKNVISANSCS